MTKDTQTFRFKRADPGLSEENDADLRRIILGIVLARNGAHRYLNDHGNAAKDLQGKVPKTLTPLVEAMKRLEKALDSVQEVVLDHCRLSARRWVAWIENGRWSVDAPIWAAIGNLINTEFVEGGDVSWTYDEARGECIQ